MRKLLRGMKKQGDAVVVPGSRGDRQPETTDEDEAIRVGDIAQAGLARFWAEVAAEQFWKHHRIEIR